MLAQWVKSESKYGHLFTVNLKKMIGVILISFLLNTKQSSF